MQSCKVPKLPEGSLFAAMPRGPPLPEASVDSPPKLLENPLELAAALAAALAYAMMNETHTRHTATITVT